MQSTRVESTTDQRRQEDRAPVAGESDVRQPTRAEMAALLSDRFDTGFGAPDKAQLLETARSRRARPEVLALLETLPEDRSFRDLRRVWRHLLTAFDSFT